MFDKYWKPVARFDAPWVNFLIACICTVIFVATIVAHTLHRIPVTISWLLFDGALLLAMVYYWMDWWRTIRPRN